MLQDFRYALRQLAKSPGFTVAVILTLALGIGATTTIFSIADRVLFSGPPYPEPGRLVVLGTKTKQSAFLNMQYPIQLAAYREQAKSFAEFAALKSSQINLVLAGEPFAVQLGRVSVDYFHTLGAIPSLGRAFLPEEDRPGADNIVVLSHRLWQSRFGGDPAVLGRDVLLAGQLCRVVGVLPKEFRPPPQHGADIYQPLSPQFDQARPFAGGYLTVIARLQPGVMPAQAEAELKTIKLATTANARTAASLADQQPKLVGLSEGLNRRLSKVYWVFLGAVGFLYAIACINAVNLMLARVLGRRKELSVRLAVGCSRGRLTRLLVTESLLLTTLAGLTGLLVSQWGYAAMMALAHSGPTPWETEDELDWRALGFTLALSLLTGLLVALVPAWQAARSDPNHALKEGGQALGESRSLQRLRNGLVVLEAALAVTLLAGAGLMVRTVRQLQTVNWGFDPANKYALWLELPPGAYTSPEARGSFFVQLEERLRAIPGVEGVAMTQAVPLTGGTTSSNIKKPDGTEVDVAMNPVSPNYLRTLGLPLKKGRWIETNATGGPSVVVINETMAREFFGEENPLGQLVNAGNDGRGWEVIGVVADVREAVRGESRMQAYYPYWQTSGRNTVSALLRTAGPAGLQVADGARRAVYAMDPRVVTVSMGSLADNAPRQFMLERYTLTVLRVLSALALTLATMGLFAVMAYAVARRTGEFGLRMALGATPTDIFRGVLRRGLGLAALGVTLGLGATLGLTHFMQSLLFETSPYDPAVYALVAALLIGVSALAAWLPARRATKINPVEALRAE